MFDQIVQFLKSNWVDLYPLVLFIATWLVFWRKIIKNQSPHLTIRASACCRSDPVTGTQVTALNISVINGLVPNTIDYYGLITTCGDKEWLEIGNDKYLLPTQKTTFNFRFSPEQANNFSESKYKKVFVMDSGKKCYTVGLKHIYEFANNHDGFDTVT